jgi:hypothetical protein
MSVMEESRGGGLSPQGLTGYDTEYILLVYCIFLSCFSLMQCGVFAFVIEGTIGMGGGHLWVR